MQKKKGGLQRKLFLLIIIREAIEKNLSIPKIHYSSVYFILKDLDMPNLRRFGIDLLPFRK